MGLSAALLQICSQSGETGDPDKSSSVGGGTEVRQGEAEAMSISWLPGPPVHSSSFSQGSFSQRDPLSIITFLLCLGHQVQGQEES